MFSQGSRWNPGAFEGGDKLTRIVEEVLTGAGWREEARADHDSRGRKR